MTTTITTKKPRGFAAMDEETKRAIASQGGKSSHFLGRAHKWTPEEAKEAGKKGGRRSRRGPAKKPQEA